MKTLPFIETRNVMNFNALCDDLESSESVGLSSMAEVAAPAGRGKSEQAKRRAAQTNAIYLPPMNVSTPRMVLSAIAFNLAGVKPGRIDGCLEVIEREMDRERRLVLVDEADLLAMPVLEMIRNVNERYSVPIVLIGEDGLKGKIASRRRLSSRVRLRVEVAPVAATDIYVFFKKCLELELAPDLISMVQRFSKGDWRPVITVVGGLDRAMRASGVNTVSEQMLKGVIDGCSS